jgi:hypothetical protein
MYSNVIFVIHGVVIFLLARMLWGASKAFQVPITIHNLPLVILTGMGLCLTTWLAMFHPALFFPTGVLLGGIMFTINSVEVPGHPNPGLLQKIGVACLATAFWPELLVFCWFYFANAKKIDKDEKSES